MEVVKMEMTCSFLFEELLPKADNEFCSLDDIYSFFLPKRRSKIIYHMDDTIMTGDKTNAPYSFESDDMTSENLCPDVGTLPYRDKILSMLWKHLSDLQYDCVFSEDSIVIRTTNTCDEITDKYDSFYFEYITTVLNSNGSIKPPFIVYRHVKSL